MVPIGVIVAVAIVCIVVAVLSSAQRADEVAVQHEKQLFSRALDNYGERVLREVESVAASSTAIAKSSASNSIRPGRNGASGSGCRPTSITTTFSSSTATTNRSIRSSAATRSTRPGSTRRWPDLKSVLDYMRGRNPALHGALRLTQPGDGADGAHTQAAVIRASRAGRRSLPPSRSDRSAAMPAPATVRRRS